MKYEVTLYVEVSNMEEWKVVNDMAMEVDSKHWHSAGTYMDEGVMGRDMEWLVDTKLEASKLQRKLRKAFFKTFFETKVTIDEYDESDSEEEE